MKFVPTVPEFEHIPELKISLPRAINRLHQIEITSRCNLRCVYCPSPKLGRPKVDMERAVFERCLEWVSYFVKAGTQFSLNLAGIGESTLHPEFADFVRLARETVGWDRQLIFATNGVKCDPNLAKEIAQYKPEVWVSLHRPSEAGKAIEIYKGLGILAGISTDPSTNANNWAKQTEWHNSNVTQLACQWLREGMAMALADGRLSACCIDASGAGVIGHVDDEIGTAKTKPYSLCPDCHQIVNIKGYNQKDGTYDE